MKRITLALLTVLLVVGAVLLPVFAANTGGVAASEAAGKIGDTVTVTVSVQDLPAVTGFAIYCEVPEGLSLVKEADQSKWLLPNLEIADVDFEKNAAVCALDEAIDCTLATEIFQFAFVIEEPEAGAALPEEFAVPIMVIASDAGSNQTKYTCEAKITASIPADGIVLNKNTLMLDLSAKKEETLFVTLTPENTTDVVNWKSSDESIVTVDENGKVTAVAQGTAKITATAGAVSADCEVTVVSITVEKGKWSMVLDSVIYLNHHPVITGAPESFDLQANGGMVIWTGSEKPTSGEALYVGAPNTEFKLGMQESTLEGYGLGVQSLEIFAKNVGDMVYVRPFVKVGENTYVYSEKAYGYSPARFCYDILCNLTGEDEGKREVCAALLEYAASAQIFFNHKTSDLVTDIPSSSTKPWDAIDLSSYDLAFKSEYLDPLNKDYAQELAPTLTGERAGITRIGYALDLEGAIRLSAGFNLNETLIPWENVAKAEVLFWTEEALAKAYAEDGSIAYELGNYSFDCKLLPKTGEEEAYLGEYRGKSDHILAKNLSETVYFTVRVEMEAEDGEEPKVYRSGLFIYSPEQFIYDCLNDETSEYKDTVCERIAVYSQKALEFFGE